MRGKTVGVVLAITLLLALGAIASAEEPPADGQPATAPTASESAATPAPQPAPIVNLVFNWDFDVIATAVRRALQETFGGIADGIQKGVLAPLGQSSLNFLTQTPPAATYAHPTVVGLWGYGRAVASAAFALILVVVGYSLMAGSAAGTPATDAIVALRGAALGLLLANTSLAWAGLAIDLGNALTAGVGQAALPGVSAAGFTLLPFESILVALVYLVMAILLILQMLMRLALLDVLIVTAPIAVLVGALPEGERWSRLWRDLFVACLISQFIQILALRLGVALMTQVLPGPADSITGFLAGIAVLVLTLRIPGLLNVGIQRAGGGAGLIGSLLALRGARGLLAGRAGAGARGSSTGATGAGGAPRPAGA